MIKTVKETMAMMNDVSRSKRRGKGKITHATKAKRRSRKFKGPPGLYPSTAMAKNMIVKIAKAKLRRISLQEPRSIRPGL